MASKFLFGGSLVLVAGAASAQNLDEARQMKGAPKDAGVYHFSTGTWTRGDNSAIQTLPGVIYNNTAPSGYFGTTSAVETNWTDEGRLPSTSGHANSKSDLYSVTGFQVAYCDAGVPGPINFGIDFYNSYTACTDPRVQTAVASFTASVPGLAAGATNSCWIVTFDVSAATLTFDLDGDADGTFDGTSSLDNFGWGLHLNDGGASGGSIGPILCYDTQGYFGCAAAEGDGTYYQAGACTSPYAFGNFGSGLGVADQHYSYAPGFGNGCYWFGGYTSTSPASGFWLVVYGDGDGDGNYCTGNSNSFSASGASISMSGDNDGTTPDEVATATNVPNQPGIFFHANNQIAVSFGCGFLCAGGGINRGNVVFTGGSNMASYAYDGSSAKRDLSGFAGSTRNFQYWYRDPMHSAVCGNTFNLSDATAYDL